MGCAAPSSDHDPVAEGRSSTLRLRWDLLPSPSPLLGSSWKDTEAFIRLKRAQRERLCLHTVTQFIHYKHCPSPNTKTINDTAKHLKHVQIRSTFGLNLVEIGVEGCLCRSMQSQRPLGVF